jgi:hypothetical protein
MLLRFDFSKNLDLSYFTRQLESALLNKKKRELQVVFSKFRITFSTNQYFTQESSLVSNTPINRLDNFEDSLLICCVEEIDDNLYLISRDDNRLSKIELFKSKAFTDLQSDKLFGLIKINGDKNIKYIIENICKIIDTFFKMQKMAAFWD